MQKIKNAIRGHRHNGDRVDEYDTTAGATTYSDTMGTTGTMGTGYNETGVGHHHHHERVEGEVVGERPVGVGVAEVPVVVTEQERVVEGHHHHHEGRIGEEVCGQKAFTEVEDRPVVRERVERIVEHRPVEKEYVVETRFVGEKEMGVAGAEIVDVKDRVVDVAAPGPTCPVGTGAMMNEVVGGVGHHHHTGVGHHHHTGVGTGLDTGMGATDMAGTTGTMEPGYGARTGASDRIL